MEKVKKILIISSDKNLREVLRFCFDGWGYEVFLQESPLGDITPIKKMAPDAIVADVHSANRSQLEVCRLLKDDFLTAFIPIITLIDKRQLRSQLLNIKQGVDDYLIKPPDPLDLRVRIEMAVKRAQHSFAASPLTGLPGGRIVEESLKERIEKDLSFTFGYIDIDNFKYFNDVYGYLKGDRVIMQTAYLLYTAIRKHGNHDDFIGHIGGDDFAFITGLDRSQEVCRRFIAAFDAIVPFHYSPIDRGRGHIVARDRSRVERKVPLMSISIALVNRAGPADYRNVVEVNERLSEVKRYLKGMPGSKFMADRRNRTVAGSRRPAVAERGSRRAPGYRPLGQILLERKAVSAEQLDQALLFHWKRGIVLGEILKDLGFVQENDLNEALNAQRAGRLDAGVAA